jgi:hypothetical protein
MLQLLNELHFEEEKTEIYTMFLIFETGIIFFNFSTPVYKMWIIQEPNMLEL